MKFNHLLDYHPLPHLSQMNDAGRAALFAEILDSSPSKKTWQALLELFAMWPENEAKAQHLDFAEQRLAGWDDSLRHADSSWSLLYQGQDLSSVARLVRSIEIDRREEHGTSELIAIAHSESAARLTSLSITRSEISHRGWQALARSSFLGQLLHLHVRKTILSDIDLEALFQSSGLPRLQCLKLVNVGLSPSRMPGLPLSIPFPSLQRMDFSDNALGDEGAVRLSQWPSLTGIRVLRLRHNFIAAPAMRILLESPFCRGLEQIDLAENRATNPEKAALLSLATQNQTQLLL